MSTYEHFVDIDAPAGAVYAFISNPENLPRFLPQVDAISVKSSDRIILISGDRQTEAAVHLDPDELTMRWNSLNKGYRGQFRVAPHDEGCRLTVTHTLDSSEASKLELERPGAIDQGQIEVLAEIRRICEGQASKLKTANEGQRYLS
jgi:hypothetical protein